MNWFLALSVSAHLVWSQSDILRENGIIISAGIVEKAEVPGKGTVLLGCHPREAGINYSLRFGSSDYETMLLLKGCPGPSSSELGTFIPGGYGGLSQVSLLTVSRISQRLQPDGKARFGWLGILTDT